MSSGADSLRRRLDAWLDADPDPADPGRAPTADRPRALGRARRPLRRAAHVRHRRPAGRAGRRAAAHEPPGRPPGRRRPPRLPGGPGRVRTGPRPAPAAGRGARRPPPLGRLRRRHRRAWPRPRGWTSTASSGRCPRRCWPSPCATSHADAGVMVTASHNPPADNGYKVYLGDGAQLVPPHDERIAAAIDAVAGHDKGRVRVADPPPALPPDEVVDAYLAATVGALASPAHRDVRVAYTPLSGVGLDVARRAFERAGFPPLDVVTSQAATRSELRRPGLPQSRRAGRARCRAGAGPGERRRRGPGQRSRRRSPGGRRARPGPGRLAAAVRQRDRGPPGRSPAAPLRRSRPVGGGVAGVVPPRGAVGPGGRRALRGHAHRLQVDRPPRPRPSRVAVPLRLRGGPGVLGQPGGAGQGRHRRRPRLRRADRRAAGPGLVTGRRGWSSWPGPTGSTPPGSGRSASPTATRASTRRRR